MCHVVFPSFPLLDYFSLTNMPVTSCIPGCLAIIKDCGKLHGENRSLNPPAKEITLHSGPCLSYFDFWALSAHVSYSCGRNCTKRAEHWTQWRWDCLKSLQKGPTGWVALISSPACSLQHWTDNRLFFFFFLRKGSQVILSKGNELWMSENHLVSPVRTVSGIGLAAFLLVNNQTVFKKWKQRWINFFNIFIPGGNQQMSGDGWEGDLLPTPLGCTLLPGCATHHSQGKFH